MKTSEQVESYWVKKYPNGIYHLLFNTRDRWAYFHQYSNNEYIIGGDIDNDNEDFIQTIPENLIPNDVRFICTTQQEKDQISFYFIPMTMLFRNGESIIYNFTKTK